MFYVGIDVLTFLKNLKPSTKYCVLKVDILLVWNSQLKTKYRIYVQFTLQEISALILFLSQYVVRVKI